MQLIITTFYHIKISDLRNGDTEELDKVVQPILMQNRVPKRETDKEEALNDLDIRPEEVRK